MSLWRSQVGPGAGHSSATWSGLVRGWGVGEQQAGRSVLEGEALSWEGLCQGKRQALAPWCPEDTGSGLSS